MSQLPGLRWEEINFVMAEWILRGVWKVVVAGPPLFLCSSSVIDNCLLCPSLSQVISVLAS